MSVIKMDDAVEAMKTVKGVINELTIKKGELTEQKKQLEDRKQLLLTQPLSLADIKDFMFDFIDRKASEYPEKAGLDRLFKSIVYPPRNPTPPKPTALTLQDIDAVANGGEAMLFGNFGLRLFGAASDLMSKTDIGAYFFFGDIIKEKIGHLFDDLCPAYQPEDEANIGPSVADRRKELSQINADMIKIRTAVADIDHQLSLLGVKPESFAEHAARNLGNAIASGEKRVIR